MTPIVIMTFADIIMVSLSGALLAFFYDSLLQEDMLLEKLGQKLEGRFWLKPLGGCAFCTAPYLTALMLVLFIYIPVAWQVVTTIVVAYFILVIIFKLEEE